jgi:hypothetical protein
MIKLDSNLPPLTLAPASALDASTLPTVVNTSLKPARRLIVLIPNVESDYTAVMPRVWELAYALKCRVLFLGLCGDVLEEPGLRRALVTMAALIQDGWVSAEAKTEIGNNWLRVVKSNWREGDLIVCFTNQQASLLHRPLGQILESKLNATVYLLSGPDFSSRRSINWFTRLTVWTGFIVTILGFFFLQMNIDRSLKGGVQTVVLVLTILVEFWLIWVWNNLFS